MNAQTNIYTWATSNCNLWLSIRIEPNYNFHLFPSIAEFYDIYELLWYLGGFRTAIRFDIHIEHHNQLSRLEVCNRAPLVDNAKKVIKNQLNTIEA